MSDNAATTTATIIPTVRYRDAQAAIDWLCEVFGFEKQLVVPGEGGTIAHAQLTFGNGMIMLGSAAKDARDSFAEPPNGFVESRAQSAYIVVKDPDAIYRSAVAAGAQIVIEIKDEIYGGRGFSCCDSEGYIWSFGSYDPWTN